MAVVQRPKFSGAYTLFKPLLVLHLLIFHLLNNKHGQARSEAGKHILASAEGTAKLHSRDHGYSKGWWYMGTKILSISLLMMEPRFCPSSPAFCPSLTLCHTTHLLLYLIKSILHNAFLESSVCAVRISLMNYILHR